MKKVAVVTGAGKGVGKALAIYLAKMQYKIILLARDEMALDAVCKSIAKEGGDAEYYSVDVAQASKVENCLSKIIKKHKQINLLINNAAILKRGTIDLSDEEIQELININLNGAIYVAKYTALHMKKQRSGYIINISSLGGKVAASFSGIYAASKFGLSGYSEALTKEMSLYDVKVTSICPSMIATEMSKGRKFQPEQMIQTSDIIKTVNYLLDLSQNAIPVEILISCLPLIKSTTEAMLALYLH